MTPRVTPKVATRRGISRGITIKNPQETQTYANLGKRLLLFNEGVGDRAEIGKDDLHKKMRTRPSIRQGRSRSVLEMPVYITGHVGGRLLHGRKENTRGTSITETEETRVRTGVHGCIRTSKRGCCSCTFARGHDLDASCAWQSRTGVHVCAAWDR